MRWRLKYRRSIVGRRLLFTVRKRFDSREGAERAADQLRALGYEDVQVMVVREPAPGRRQGDSKRPGVKGDNLGSGQAR